MSTLLTVKDFSQRHPVFTEGSLRWHIFNANTRQTSRGVIPGNGLIEAGAIKRIGRKVVLDEEKFLEWVDACQEQTAATHKQPREHPAQQQGI